ncbi:MAG: DUF2851 family protein [Acidobacteriota bacterium]
MNGQEKKWEDSESFLIDYLRKLYPYWITREGRVVFSEYGLEKRIAEKLVQSIWFDQRLRMDKLKTNSGEKVEVLSPGKWNSESGPDFIQAAIKISSAEVLRGDIEIHVLASDWFAHNHHQDKNYDKVILHVIMWDDLGVNKKLVNSAGREIPQLPLYHALDTKLTTLSNTINPSAYPFASPSSQGPCYSVIRAKELSKIGVLLDLAGDARIVSKADRFAKELSQEDYNQVIYQRIMEALGYKRNKEQFLLLARQLPLKEIREVLSSTKPSMWEITLQGLLFGMSGILPSQQELPLKPAVSQDKYIRELEQSWERLKGRYQDKVLLRDIWKNGMRPANFPARRIAGMCHFLIRIFPLTLLHKLLMIFCAPGISAHESHFKKINKEMKELFRSVEEDYWSWHYTFAGKTLKKSIRLIGPGRAATIIVNVIIPALILYARNKEHKQLENLLIRFYHWYPKLPSNSLLRFMEYRLFAYENRLKKVVNSARRQQGLLQIYQDWCSREEKVCQRCGFKRVLEAI